MIPTYPELAGKTAFVTGGSGGIGAETARWLAHNGDYRGLSGVQDWNLMAPIREGDFTFVTNNAKDFRRLYAREDIHAGLVILIPNVPPDLQQVAVRRRTR